MNSPAPAAASQHSHAGSGETTAQHIIHRKTSGSSQPLPEKVSIEPITLTHLPAYRRLTTLLLPIRYPDKFYKDSVSITGPSSLALCALWHEPTQPRHLVNGVSNGIPAASEGDPFVPFERVVAGIQCRLEPVPSPTTPTKPEQTLYIQTLATLAPYRSFGIASALLDTNITTVITHHKDVTSIYAHVWEANEEALEWYGKRGFVVELQVVEGYYRKLRPSGARVVRRRVGVGDYLKAKGSAPNEVTARGDGEDLSVENKDEEIANG